MTGTAPRECLVCDTVNPAHSKSCDCGYVFRDGDRSVAHRQAALLMWRGAMMIGLGAVVLAIFAGLSRWWNISWERLPGRVIAGLIISGIPILLYGLRKRLSRRS